MKIQVSREREREQRFTAERGNKTPTKSKLVYFKYTHTNNCAHTIISEESAYPTED